MSSLLKLASKQVSDVRTFLRESASGNSIKYTAEKGAKHRIYFPYVEQQVQDEQTGNIVTVKKPVAISCDVHEWTTADGKYKATICQDGIFFKDENGTVQNDGTCPFCDRVQDAWEIYKYRMAKEEATCQLTGDNRSKHFEKIRTQFADERKIKEKKTYCYLLVVKFVMNGNLNSIGADGLPEYELKVMKLSTSKLEKIQNIFANAGAELTGGEIIFEYGNVEDRRLLAGQATMSPVFPNNSEIVQFPQLVNKINQDVAKFDFDNLDKSFVELNGMTTEAARAAMTNSFEKWDEYKKQLTTNSAAQYLEYVSQNVNNPSMDATAGAPAIGGGVPGVAVGQAPQIGVPAGGVQMQMPNIQMPNIPAQGQQMQGQPFQMPNVGQQDVNGVFNNAGGQAPAINM